MPPDVWRPRPTSLTWMPLPGVVVGLGEAKVLKAHPDGEDSLVAYGLGSCVAVCLWDPESKVAGMAHVVLPGEDPTGAPNAKFARSALPALLELMQAAGATGDPRRLAARLAGGAQVLSLDGSRNWTRVGDANALAVQEAMAVAGVNVEAEDLGGSLGRSVWFDPRDRGQIRVRAIGSTDRYL
jgi:chemotaxis protein CheD